jgi:hypothetical protein
LDRGRDKNNGDSWIYGAHIKNGHFTREVPQTM